jgi:hypothetical protein
VGQGVEGGVEAGTGICNHVVEHASLERDCQRVG